MVLCNQIHELIPSGAQERKNMLFFLVVNPLVWELPDRVSEVAVLQVGNALDCDCEECRVRYRAAEHIVRDIVLLHAANEIRKIGWLTAHWEERHIVIVR
jgi:hypothetical protein